MLTGMDTASVMDGPGPDRYRTVCLLDPTSGITVQNGEWPEWVR
jgi:hypothetical protein